MVQLNEHQRGGKKKEEKKKKAVGENTKVYHSIYSEYNLVSSI